MNNKGHATQILIPQKILKVIKKIETQDKNWSKQAKQDVDNAFQASAIAREASADEVSVLADEISELTLSKYALRERYARNIEILDVESEKITDWMTKTYKDMLESFIKNQFKKVREDINKDHRWYTGLQDTGEQIKNVTKKIGHWIGKQVDAENISEEPEESESFLTHMIQLHFNDKIFEDFCIELDGQINNGAMSKWQKVVKQVENDLAISRETLKLRTDVSNLQTDMDTGSAAAVIGFGAAITSTVVLAAGWHTLAWSISGLFLPLLPVVIAASLGAAVLGKERAMNKLLSSATDYEETITKSLLETVEYRTRKEFDKSNKAIAIKIKEQSFHNIVGSFDAILLDSYIRALEDFLDELLSLDVSSNSSSDESKNTQEDQWLVKAQNAMTHGDELAAAMYGTFAFEQLLHNINRTKKLKFNFRVPHHNRAFIDRLSKDPSTPPQTITALRSLKSRRDMFTHRMHHVAATNKGRRTRMINKFLNDLSQQV